MTPLSLHPCVFLCMFLRLLASLTMPPHVFQMHAKWLRKSGMNSLLSSKNKTKKKKKKTRNEKKTNQSWRFDAWAVPDTCHLVKPSAATSKMVRRAPTSVRSLRSRKIRRTRTSARSLAGVACCREVPRDAARSKNEVSRTFFFFRLVRHFLFSFFSSGFYRFFNASSWNWSEELI